MQDKPHSAFIVVDSAANMQNMNSEELFIVLRLGCKECKIAWDCLQTTLNGSPLL